MERDPDVHIAHLERRIPDTTLHYSTFAKAPIGPQDVAYLDLCGNLDEAAVEHAKDALRGRKHAVLAVTICLRNRQNQRERLHDMMRAPPVGMRLVSAFGMPKPGGQMYTYFATYSS